MNAWGFPLCEGPIVRGPTGPVGVWVLPRCRTASIRARPTAGGPTGIDRIPDGLPNRRVTSVFKNGFETHLSSLIVESKSGIGRLMVRSRSHQTPPCTRCQVPPPVEERNRRLPTVVHDLEEVDIVPRGISWEVRPSRGTASEAPIDMGRTRDIQRHVVIHVTVWEHNESLGLPEPILAPTRQLGSGHPVG